MTVTEATAWGAESDKNRSQASYYNLVTDTRIAPKEAWSYLNPARGSSRWLAVAVGAVVGGGRPANRSPGARPALRATVLME